MYNIKGLFQGIMGSGRESAASAAQAVLGASRGRSIQEMMAAQSSALRASEAAAMKEKEFAKSLAVKNADLLYRFKGI